MFEILAHYDGIGRARDDAEIAKRAHAKVVHKRIDAFFLFSIGSNLGFIENPDGSVGTSDLAGAAAGATMLVFLIVEQHHFTPETVRQLECVFIFGIRRRVGFAMMKKIIAGEFHSSQERPDRPENREKIIGYKSHNRIRRKGNKQMMLCKIFT